MKPIMDNALLVVAKQPFPGQTKTRLSPPLSSQQAAVLYECFLRDTLELMRCIPGVHNTIVYLPRSAEDYFRALAPDMNLMLQKGENLGERLDNLLTESLSNGALKAVVMDSDSPTLPADYILHAFRSLDDADVVLGPTEDGGYYLIGMKKPHPRLMREIQMSTPQVLQDTLILAEKCGVKVSLLPSWYDVDTVEELLKIKVELLSQPTNPARHTRNWLIQETW
jgi:hypothetical protein